MHASHVWMANNQRPKMHGMYRRTHLDAWPRTPTTKGCLFCWLAVSCAMGGGTSTNQRSPRSHPHPAPVQQKPNQTYPNKQTERARPRPGRGWCRIQSWLAPVVLLALTVTRTCRNGLMVDARYGWIGRSDGVMIGRIVNVWWGSTPPLRGAFRVRGLAFSDSFVGARRRSAVGRCGVGRRRGGIGAVSGGGVPSISGRRRLRVSLARR